MIIDRVMFIERALKSRTSFEDVGCSWLSGDGNGPISHKRFPRFPVTVGDTSRAVAERYRRKEKRMRQEERIRAASGCGVIWKRVTAAVARQDDLELAGVADPTRAQPWHRAQ